MMQNKRIFAVTGSIGSGKSTLCAILKKFGDVVSCDEENRALLTDKDYLEKLKNNFPETFSDGKFDKGMMTKLIFSDENARAKLNAIAHPLILERVIKRINECASNVIFVEVPLLSGTAFEKMFSDVIVVTADNETRLQRIVMRDGIDIETAKKKIAGQTDIPTFDDKNVCYVDNSGTKEELENQLNTKLKKFINE